MNKLSKESLKFQVPVDPRIVKQQQNFDYVPGDYVIDRLNEVSPKWDFEITEFGVVNQKETMVAYAIGKLTTSLGTRMAMGTGVLRGQLSTNADAFIKGAGTDALKKAATMFGIAAELYPDRDIVRRTKGKGRMVLSDVQRKFAREICIFHGVETDEQIESLLVAYTSISKMEELTADNYNEVLYALINAIPEDEA